MDRRLFLKLTLATLTLIPTVSSAKMTLRAIDNSDTMSYDEPKEVTIPLTKKSYGSKLRSKTRVLKLYNVHTKEKLNVKYFSDGGYHVDALDKINFFFRDFRENISTDMDRDLIDLLYSLQMKQSRTQPLYLNSGYRTAKTNNKLRKKSKKVAKNSYHTQGMAADIRPKYNSRARLKKLKNQARAAKVGGVGYYPSDRFVHVDSGRVRSWKG